MSDNPPIEAEEMTDDGGFAFLLEEVRKEPEGLVLQRTKILFGIAPLEFPRYQATIRAVIGQDMKTRQPIVATGQIPIHATSLEDAFKRLPALMESASVDLKEAALKEMSRPKIQLPPGVKGPTPNGEPNLKFRPPDE